MTGATIAATFARLGELGDQVGAAWRVVFCSRSFSSTCT